MARRETRVRHQRYPGGHLTAFVVETQGRPGSEAAALLRTLARDPGDANEAWIQLVCVLQHGSGNARMLRAAAEGAPAVADGPPQA